MARKKKAVSKQGEFTRKDAEKVARGALIAGGGALVVYVLQSITQYDFGDLTPLVVAFSSVLLNFVRKYITENSY